jgi:hypothetical protein
MTKEVLPENTTNVSGYYNGNRWPIQLVVSRLNVTLHLQPGDFILDKQQRKINDPFFDLYTKPNQLSRELSDKPVPIISVPSVGASTAPTAPDGQAVRAVMEFTRDAKGVKQPVIPAPRVMENQSVNKAPITAMTMDQARQAGLIRKVREVPEDYGVTDTNSASPPRTPPAIKYAMDTDQPAKPQGDLPQRLKAAVPRNMAQERTQMQKQLEEAEATTEMLDSETGFLNVATRNIPSGAGFFVGTPAPVAEASADDNLPAPNLENDDALPAPTEDEEEVPIPEQKVKPVNVPSKGRFVCMECTESFKFRPELVGHAKRKHSDKINAILAAYPLK